MNASASYAGDIRLVLFDVDGVLTDGTLYYDSRGEVMKRFNARDGIAVALLRCHGIATGVISGKSSPALDCRIAQLGLDAAVTGTLDKTTALDEIISQTGWLREQIAYVGDDVVDIPLAGRVAKFYAPADAHALVLACADHVLSSFGGSAVAREVAEHVLIGGGLDLKAAYAPLISDWSRANAVQ